jgi:TonB-dependent starch-binding outer membrane protein SusC
MENQTKPVGLNRQLKKLLLKMKLTLTIILFCLVGATASTYSQNTRLDVKIENGTMVELIKLIEAKSEFMFYYQKDELSELDNLTVEAQNATVMEILDQATEGTRIRLYCYRPLHCGAKSWR